MSGVELAAALGPASASRAQPRVVIAVVMLCHFVAAFAALGMPPFFALILERSLHAGQPFLAGWLYVVPTFFTALSSPWWGKLADRYGKKRLLLRAQLGLAASFLLASCAPNVECFVAALVLQGLLGGTFSASNAYLATVVSGTALMRSLTLMQWSARAALVAAPLGLGWLLMHSDTPLQLYRWLAMLPLCAAAGIWLLPASGEAAGQGARAIRMRAGAGTEARAGVGAGARAGAGTGAEAGAADAAHAVRAGNTAAAVHAGNAADARSAAGSNSAVADSGAAAATARQIYLLQWLFVFAVVATMPYFVSYVHAPLTTPAMAGLLFGLPHLVYLLCAVPLSRWLGRSHLLATMAGACAMLALALAGQAWSGGADWQLLGAWRLLMGLGMTLAYLSLHGLIAGLVKHENAGRTFGWFESSSKWGGVAAGVAAGLLVQQAGLRAPFAAGAAVMLACGVYAAALACGPGQHNFWSKHASK
ncbi:MFS transporter [Pseudoduganella sp. LjRoot289]|uniref:MFS transporter n=1 Tax=Pseudoduganella sp. LjRoot289 TaxID=3342314 RepID=UPI003ED02761